MTAESTTEGGVAKASAQPKEAIGEIILSTSFAAAYGLYLLLTDGTGNFSAYLLIAGGASSALLIHLCAKAARAGTTLAPRSSLGPLLLVVPYVFALYLVVVVGLLASAQAIIGHAGFWAIVTGIFWAFDGGRLLFVLGRMRKVR